MKQNDKYVFDDGEDNGILTCVITRIEKNKIYFNMLLSTFESSSTKDDFIKHWKPFEKTTHKVENSIKVDVPKVEIAKEKFKLKVQPKKKK